jgi:ribonucleoside-diphosphate reductase alpha chain
MILKTDLAYKNWSKKYRFGNEKPIETFIRSAKAVAAIEKHPQEWYKQFLQVLLRFDSDITVDENGYPNKEPLGLKATFGGRITANVGTTFKNATLMNCFVNGPVSGATIHYNRKSKDGSVSYDVDMKTDDNPDNLSNIFLTILEQAKTLASEGGYGINFGFIRPRGSLIKGTGIKHPGVMSYMKLWDTVSECMVKGDTDGYVDNLKNHLTKEQMEELQIVVKGDTRKGAMLGCLPVWHPDIEEFVKSKQSKGVLTKFNISVLIDDKFMNAVLADDFYDLHFKGKVYKKVNARELYELIMSCTYNRAEPGVLFYDSMQRNNPVAYLGDCNACNPCGEVPGIADITTVCLLGSLNVTQYVYIEDGVVKFDEAKYIRDICTFTRMLDNINDLSNAPLPSYEYIIKKTRQFGMGLNGLGSALMMMGIAYNSKEAVKFTSRLCELKENYTWQASALLAKEKGQCEAYVAEKFQNTEYFQSNRLWPKTKEMIVTYGVRNAKTTTNPPLGNSSIIADNVSNGIEPAFLLEYDRKNICHWPKGLNIENVKHELKHHKGKDFEYWQGTFEGKTYYYEPHNRGLCEVSVVRDYGYQWLLDNFPKKDHKSYLVTTKDLLPQDHINIQKVVQYHCNQSVSKTCNLPKDYPFEDFKSLYIDAWQNGLNGFTVYRDGCMESVISSLAEAEAQQKIIAKDIKLPDVFLNGQCHIIKCEGLKFYIHFSYLPEDTEMKYPICLWIYSNSREVGRTKTCNRAARKLAHLALQKGIDASIISDCIEKARTDYSYNRLGRMISLCLRHNVKREDILVALQNIEGDYISSLLTAVRHFIGMTIKDGTRIDGMKCPECKSENVEMSAGCFKCKDCGNSRCG